MSASDFPNPEDYREQHAWTAAMLRQFADELALQFVDAGVVRGLTVAYLDKLLGDVSPPLPPDVVQLYERMNTMFLAITDRETS